MYARHALRPYDRITPYTQPPGHDTFLVDQGMERIDDTRVMVAALPETSDTIASDAGVDAGWRFEPVASGHFAEWVGAQRGSPASERIAHAERLRDAPGATSREFLVTDAKGETIAGGQVALEDDLAGLYDIVTAAAARKQGLALKLCRHLLAHARREGARVAYLQVEAQNEPARRVYRRLGFEDAYSYHYRSPPAA